MRVQTPTRSNLAYSDYETRSNNEVVQGLPEAFFGQQVEDLAYGAGSPGTNIGVGIPRELVRGSLGEEDDEEVRVSPPACL